MSQCHLAAKGLGDLDALLARLVCRCTAHFIPTSHGTVVTHSCSFCDFHNVSAGLMVQQPAYM